MTTIHFLKSWERPFRQVQSGIKTLEIRPDDRDPKFATGDIVVLERYEPEEKSYRGDMEVRRIGFIERGEHTPKGFCAFALVEAKPGDAELLESFHDEPNRYSIRRRLRFAVSQ